MVVVLHAAVAAAVYSWFASIPRPRPHPPAWLWWSLPIFPVFIGLGLINCLVGGRVAWWRLDRWGSLCISAWFLIVPTALVTTELHHIRMTYGVFLLDDRMRHSLGLAWSALGFLCLQVAVMNTSMLFPRRCVRCGSKCLFEAKPLIIRRGEVSQGSPFGRRRKLCDSCELCLVREPPQWIFLTPTSKPSVQRTNVDTSGSEPSATSPDRRPEKFLPPVQLLPLIPAVLWAIHALATGRDAAGFLGLGWFVVAFGSWIGAALARFGLKAGRNRTRAVAFFLMLGAASTAWIALRLDVLTASAFPKHSIHVFQYDDLLVSFLVFPLFPAIISLVALFSMSFSRRERCPTCGQPAIPARNPLEKLPAGFTRRACQACGAESYFLPAHWTPTSPPVEPRTLVTWFRNRWNESPSCTQRREA